MMRNVDKFRLFQWLLLLGCLLCVPHSAQAQAWDGEGDIKFMQVMPMLEGGLV